MGATKTPAADLTIAELAAVLGHVLGADYDGVHSGRVRDLPDERTIRWYQTRGLVDRPAALRGRTALFGRRHVLQLAAIKRLQAAGQPLAAVQRSLAGSTDAELARAAGMRLGDVERAVAAVTGARAVAAPAPRLVAMRPQSAVTPVADTHAACPTGAHARPAGAFWKSRPQAAPASQTSAAGDPAPALQSLGLGGNATVVWHGRPLTAEETAALVRLARPFVEFLSRSTSGAAEPAGGACPSSARPEESEARP